MRRRMDKLLDRAGVPTRTERRFRDVYAARSTWAAVVCYPLESGAIGGGGFRFGPVVVAAG